MEMLLAVAALLPLAPPQATQASEASARHEAEESIRAQARMHFDAGKAPDEKSACVSIETQESGLSVTDCETIYLTEYAKQRKLAPLRNVSWNVGWYVAALLLVLHVLRRKLEAWLSALFDFAVKPVANRLAGMRLFRRYALKKYRCALVQQCEKVFIPFDAGKELDVRSVYVPMDAAGAENDRPIDAQQAVARYRRLSVVGTPGSGKSMLLKHLTLAYAEGSMAEPSGRTIPILLELHRCSSSDQTLEQHLVEELARNSFPNASSFVKSCLKNGTLTLLLDGFDEVSQEDRGRVSQEINDLLNRYRRCRAIITCRMAVYRDEFRGVVDQALTIVEFSDQQVRRFLGNWETQMPQGKSVEQLLLTLQDRPRIMHLARNPLMLTIIAYLYTDPDFVLPHSRADFYESAVEVLLRHKHGLTQYEGPAKRRVLQHLAVVNQAGQGPDQGERRTMDFTVVLDQIAGVLPALNLKQEEAGPMLTEIVERSGLLVAVDGGERYQFAHLSLQEFFAADKLRADSDKLFELFKNDPASWRETVKLWCGLAAESTSLIRRVLAEDPITAFECLAEARMVEPTLVDTITASMKPLLGQAKGQDSVLRAFGVVASDQRPRGAGTFEFLAQLLTGKHSSNRRRAAAMALSMTNLPSAAKVLADRYRTHPEVREPLVRMGDLAVVTLGSLAAEGSIETIDQLLEIGTPNAVHRATLLLWQDDPAVATAAAWRLAEEMPSDSTAELLDTIDLPPISRTAPTLPWVWEPFAQSPDSPLTWIAERVAYLIANSPGNSTPSQVGQLDARLVIPLCAVHNYSEIDLSRACNDAHAGAIPVKGKSLAELPDWQRRTALRSEVTRLAGGKKKPKNRQRFVVAMLNAADASPRWRCLFGGLPARTGLELLARLLGDDKATRAHWTNVFRPTDYEFKASWHYRAIWMVFGALALCALGSTVIEIATAPTWLNWANGGRLAMFLGGAATVIWVVTKDGEFWAICTAFLIAPGIYALGAWLLEDPFIIPTVLMFLGRIFEYHWAAAVGVIILALLVWGLLNDFGDDSAFLGAIIVGLVLAGVTWWAHVYTTCQHLFTVAFSSPATMLLWIGLGLGVLALRVVGTLRHRMARNPLTDLVPPPKIEAHRPRRGILRLLKRQLFARSRG
ncbi:MAG: NACHT domain-containing protein [bacterium]|nr:NACHT domain-containing protein [bacterium]